MKLKKILFSILLVALFLGNAFAGSIINYPKFKAFDSDGNPLSGGKVYFYIPGSTTPKATYSDFLLTTPTTNPVILDSNGEASIYGSGSYKIILKTSADASIWTFDNIYGLGLGTEINANNYSSINAAVTAIGATEATLLVSDAQTLTANLTIPSTLVLKVLKGGSIVKASTYTLTINGPFEAGLYQVFSGFDAGDVTFGSGIIKEVYPQWWGAKGDGVTDDTTAVQCGLTAASVTTSGVGRIVFPVGIYIITSSLTPPTNATIIGLGQALGYPGVSSGKYAQLKKTTDGDLFTTTNLVNLIIENIRLLGDQPTTTTGIAIEATGYMMGCVFKNVQIEKFPEYGIYANEFYYCVIDKCNFYYNLLEALKIDFAANVSQINSTTFTGNEGDYCITLDAGYSFSIKNSMFNQNKKGGIRFTAVKYSSIENCYFEGNNVSLAAGSIDILLDSSCRSNAIKETWLQGGNQVHTGIQISNDSALNVIERCGLTQYLTTGVNIGAGCNGTKIDHCYYDVSITDGGTYTEIFASSYVAANMGINYTHNIQPQIDNTYYLGKNDDDSPLAWKGVILKDTTNGKYYRIEVINGVVTATDLTD